MATKNTKAARGNEQLSHNFVNDQYTPLLTESEREELKETLKDNADYLQAVAVMMGKAFNLLAEIL